MYPTHAPHQPKGFVLITSLVMLMVLSGMLLWSMRGALQDERMTSNDAGIVMAREYAEMALRDAELDIQGLAADGVNFRTTRAAGSRPTNAVDGFWRNTEEQINVASVDGSNPVGMYDGNAAIAACGKAIWRAADWQDGVARQCIDNKTTVPTIAYGQFTGAVFQAPIFVTPPRYMIEVFTPGELGLETQYSGKTFFRITAVGYGPGIGNNRSSTTLQTIFSPSN